MAQKFHLSITLINASTKTRWYMICLLLFRQHLPWIPFGSRHTHDPPPSVVDNKSFNAHETTNIDWKTQTIEPINIFITQTNRSKINAINRCNCCNIVKFRQMLLRISIAAILIVCTASLSTVDMQNGERILSRRRRYLTFPEGSSLQLGKWQSTIMLHAHLKLRTA